MKAYNSKESLVQNLKDAGCENEQIQEIIELYEEGKKETIYKMLEEHRKKVLNDVHKSEKKIDCIDYYIYQLKTEDKD